MNQMHDYQQIIEEHHPILYKIGRVYSDGDDFDDLYQEMLIAIWKGLKNFNGEAKISTWLYRVVLNTALSYQKTKKRRSIPTVDFSNAENSQQESPSDKFEKEAELQRLYESIHGLKKDERSIILLYLEDKSYDEISEIIGITKSNVGVRINRIKKKLLEKMSN